MQNPLLEAALTYAAQGWPVLPLHTWTGRCSCGDGQCSSPAKHPRTPHGLQDASTDQAVLEEWWRRWPDSNVGVRCDQLFVLDLDGPQAIDALRAHDLDPDLHTWVNQTGVGRHLLFAAEPTARPKTRVLPDVDVRAGSGSYIVAPPSVHWTGAVYESLMADGPLLSLPATIRQAIGLGEGPARSSTVRDPDASNGAQNAPVSSIADALAVARDRGLLGVGEGGRHDALLRLVGGHLAVGLMDLPELLAWTLTWAAACSPPYPREQALRDASDIWDRHAAQHGGDPVFDYGGGVALQPPVSVLDEAWGAIDVRAMLSNTPAQQRWLLRHPTRDWRPCPPWEGDGMLECGVVGVLSASGGSGKSMLLLQMAVSLLTGKPWVGFTGPALSERGRVCYLAGEDRQESLHRRLLAVVDGLGLDDDERDLVADRLRIVSLARRPFRLFEVDGQDRLCPGRGYEDLRRHLGEDGGGKWSAVILDPAARLCGATIELDNDQATSCVQHLEQLSDSAGDAAILLAVHVSKATKLAGQSHARGVSGLGDAARWHLGLVQDRLEFHKANDAVPWQDRPVYLSRQGRLFARADGPPVHENPGDIAAVVEVARRLGAQTNRDVLWQNAGLTQGPGRAAVRDALRRYDLTVTSRPTGKTRSGNPVVHATNDCRCAECSECASQREDALNERAPIPF